jgi:hypothetical protein
MDIDNDAISAELTEYDQRRVNRIDKYVDHMDRNIQTKPLTEAEEEYFEVLHKAFHWSNKFFSPQDVIKMLQDPKEAGGKAYSKSMAYQIFHDSQYLFGNVEELNEIALKKTLTEHIMKSSQMIMQCKDSSLLAKGVELRKNALAIKELYNLGANENKLDPEKLMPPANITFVMQGTNNKIEVIESKQEQINFAGQ